MELSRFVLGRPLRTQEGNKEQINPVEGLSALSLDALTSVAYGPQAMLLVLGAGGLAALKLAPWVTAAIVGLLVLLVISYLQVIAAFPGGGGAYAVAHRNLGPNATLLAGAALIVDYTLTVAVSIAAGVGSLVSAFPTLAGATVPLCLLILAVVTIFNLRGLGEGARAFLLPTLGFIAAMLLVIGMGIIHPLAPHAPTPGASQVATRAVETIGVLLVLKAFSSGCSALTGVEAIANGVPLFRKPRVTRAKQTELMLGGLLAVTLIGLAVLIQKFHIQPRANDAVLNQVVGFAVGRGPAFDAISILITLALALAANTSFGGLPILASLLARDNCLPHFFAIRGDRLVFSRGVVALTAMAAVLLVATGGNTDSLIPLYAIGVFTGFTLAQSGLVRHWLRERGRSWRLRVAVNGLGALVTCAAVLIFIFTKFTEGAWAVVVAVPLLILLFVRVRRYYRLVGEELHLGRRPGKPRAVRTTVVVPVTAVSRLTQEALIQARSLSEDVVAVTVAFEDDPPGERPIEKEWAAWDPGVRLVVVHSHYHSVARPLVRFVGSLHPSRSHRVVVLIPVLLPRHRWHSLLHNHMELVVGAALRRRPNVLVARLPLPLHED